MNRIKAWLRQWLCAVSFAELEAERNWLRSVADSGIAKLKAEHDAAIAQLIMDMNGIRNQTPAATAQATKSNVRVLRNFGEFRAAIEVTPQRKS